MVIHLVPVPDYKVGPLGDVCGLALFWCNTIRPLLIKDGLFCKSAAFQGVQLLAVEGLIERESKGEQLVVNDSLPISKNSQQNIPALQSGLGLGTLPNIVYSNFDCAELKMWWDVPGHRCSCMKNKNHYTYMETYLYCYVVHMYVQLKLLKKRNNESQYWIQKWKWNRY